MSTAIITAARVREILYYDPLTGIFRRAVGHPGTSQNSIAGCPNSNRYIYIEVDGRKYTAHRLAWLYMTGEWPIDQIDHWDTNPANNAWANLREADDQLNRENMRRAMKNNKLGLLGVSKARGLFRAQIQVQGKVKHLGTFTTPELAHAAYLSAKRIHHAGSTL